MSAELFPIVGVLTGTVGALTGAASLIWQVSIHRRSGRLVSVVVSNVIPVYGPRHAPEFRDDDQVALTVINRGGAPVSVLNFGVRIGRASQARNLFVVDPHPMSTPLPAVVEPGGQPVQVTVPVNELRRAERDLGVPFRQMRPWVELGDGRRILSRKPVPLK